MKIINNSFFIDIEDLKEVCNDYCYCKEEGTMYSSTKNGNQHCAFCWLLLNLGVSRKQGGSKILGN